MTCCRGEWEHYNQMNVNLTEKKRKERKEDEEEERKIRHPLYIPIKYRFWFKIKIFDYIYVNINATTCGKTSLPHTIHTFRILRRKIIIMCTLIGIEPIELICTVNLIANCWQYIKLVIDQIYLEIWKFPFIFSIESNWLKRKGHWSGG